MKRMGAVESDSVKSAMKAKDMLHRACERASETREQTLHGQEQNNAYGKHERVTRQWSISSQHKYNHMHCCAEGLALQCLSFMKFPLICCTIKACCAHLGIIDTQVTCVNVNWQKLIQVI